MRTLPDPSLTAAEWAWCAGLFEGEGCIAWTSTYGVKVCVAMCDYDVLDRLDALWPSPNGIRPKQRNESGKQQWEWGVAQCERVRGFLEGVYPWLGDRRRARADEALERLSYNRGARGSRTQCPYGHSLADAYRGTGGSRQCRPCRIATERAKRAAMRHA